MESTELGRRESGMKMEEQRVVVVGSRWRAREEERREGGGREGRESEVCDIQSFTPEFIFLFCLLFGELECKFQLEFLFIRVSGSGLLHILFSPVSFSF